MFSVNDKILYPMHGAGIIKEIEDVEILGEIKQYYVLLSSCSDMKIMIPVEKSEDIGVRPIVDADTAAKVIELLKEPSTEMPNNWNRRYRENVAKIKTGNIFTVAEVVRNLVRIDRVKKLSTGEKKLLLSARQILVSEIALATDKSVEQITELVNEAI